MRKYFAAILALTLIIIAFPALAADVMLQAPVTRADTMLDKNGKEYIRLIVTETRTLNGVKYDKEIPVMAFGSQVQAAKAFKVGDKFKGICAARTFEDRSSYTVLKVINP
jgi:hypothetical protein